MTLRLLLALGCILTVGRVADAGKFNPTLDIGDAAPAWKDLPGIDGKRHSLADLKQQKAVVLVFTCNSCPYAVEYEQRLMALTQKLKAMNVAVVAVNVNKNKEDDLDAMKKRAAEQKFNFTYLYDDTQKIARDYDPTYTPEFFLLDGKRKIAYMGSMDDSPDPKKVKVRHLEKAVQAVLAGEKVAVAETAAIGCRIRIERQRRKRKPRK